MNVLLAVVNSASQGTKAHAPGSRRRSTRRPAWRARPARANDLLAAVWRALPEAAKVRDAGVIGSRRDASERRSSAMCRSSRIALFCVLLSFATLAAAALTVVDDRGAAVALPRGPAQRIISLAPHITELLFAAGAGDRVVGTVAYSDYPEAARKLPRVGDVNALDLERIVALRPDLVIVWLQGSPQAQLEVLKGLSVPIYYNEPRTLDDIGRTIERFGRLAGTEAVAQAAADAFRARLARMRARYRERAPVSVFHQVWDEPLLTVNDESLISQALALCGGRNVFGSLAPLVPQVSIEAVLDADPEVIGTAAGEGVTAASDAGLGAWLGWPRLTAVARHNLYVVDADLITRHTPRILDAAEHVCAALDAARQRRPKRQ